MKGYTMKSNEEYRKMSPEERDTTFKKEFELTKNMSLDELYAELAQWHSKKNN